MSALLRFIWILAAISTGSFATNAEDNIRASSGLRNLLDNHQAIHRKEPVRMASPANLYLLRINFGLYPTV
jgi:hypothetical protein